MKTAFTAFQTFLLPLSLAILGYLHAGAAEVKVTEEDIVIPTYLAGDPEPNPMFYFGRGSQGAAGRVYPYALYDTLTNIKSNKAYRIVYLENEYVRIGILPEIGGRLFEGVDKSNGYSFIYRQHVIKPALIGLIGAWISGGIEWNIPHHHRATTFLPVQYHVTANADGSKTVWVGELEVRHRMRWAVGYTLHPGRSYLQCSVRILNRMPVANTMLCFANVAVHVNENYQVIYPPSTRFVTFHSKHEFTTWPIATTRYAGADFTRGVDVSWYSNHISANSMFAWNYQDDFFAGYDHGREAGIMSVADHHMVPGKKFWTWGNGPRGRMWDKILTDTDGPYIELMVGAYSDNQPDYSWLQPFETKSVEMYWYPFRQIGGVKNANLEAGVNLEVTPEHVAKVGFCTTRAYRSAEVSVTSGGKVLLREQIAIDPTRPFVKQVALPAGVDQYALHASLRVEGRELVGYSPVRLEPEPMPAPVKDPPPPKEMKTIEELYLAGQRIEQFHNASLDPEAYWQEALNRDPNDARVNTSLGIRRLKEGRFADAEQCFRKALDRLTANYTAPKNGEAFYYLGLALDSRTWDQPCSETRGDKRSGGAGDRWQEARDAFSQATWSEGWGSPAYFALAEIATRQGDYSNALALVGRALDGNGLNLRAFGLKAALLRHVHRVKEALAVADLAVQKTGPLDVRLMAERWLGGDKKALGELSGTLRNFPDAGLEAAAEYAHTGLWADGTKLLELLVDSAKDQKRVSPLVYYYLAQSADRLGEKDKAAEYRRQAVLMPHDYVFPFQWETEAVLREAIAANPDDARARYYLGNLLFDSRPKAAVELWEKSAALEPRFPITHRNLALAYRHAKPKPDLSRAIAELELAVGAPEKYALHFAELDELYAVTGASPQKRLTLLEANHGVVTKRDDALSREIGLKVFAGKYDEAIELMTGRKFSVWEGGSLEVVDHWVNAHLLRGRRHLAGSEFALALEDFQAAGMIPENLPTERELSRQAELAYWAGEAYQGLGKADKARESWRRAAEASTPEERRGSRGRFSQRDEQSFFQALAKRKLGETTGAEEILHRLARTVDHVQEETTDVKEPQASASEARGHYVAGLGYLGLGETEKAKTEFQAALKTVPDHLGAETWLRADCRL